jgi:hypothetical protein
MGMNIVLLIFNILPIYPLDGGQMLQALLWALIGRWESLQVVSIVGMIVGGLVALLAPVLLPGGWILSIIAIFIALRSFGAYFAASELLRLERLPRNPHAACPSCHAHPPAGLFWVCDHCGTRFDTFATEAECPKCGAWFHNTTCPFCHNQHRIDQWFTTPS